VKSHPSHFQLMAEESFPAQTTDVVNAPPYIAESTRDSVRDGTHSGWLLSPSEEGYLMFVPLDAKLCSPSCILTISQSAVSTVDFSKASIGTRWHECYSPDSAPP